MRFPPWLRPLAAGLTRARPRPPRRPAFRPRVEALEDRTVPSPVPPPAGLTNWWPGDGSPADIVGAANGTLVGGAGYAAGEVNQAFDFTGPGQYVGVSGPATVSGPRTVEGWVRPDPNTGLGLPIATFGTALKGDFFGVAGTTGTNNGTAQYDLYVDHWGVPTYHSTATLTPGAWDHVALTYDGSTVRFYVNGQPAGAVTGGLYDYPLDTATIGGNRIGGTTTKGSFRGGVDELSLYDRALSADEVRAIYQAGPDGKARFSVLSSTPAAGSVVSAPPTDFAVHFSAAVAPASLQPGDFTVNGVAADSFTLTGGSEVTFHYNASPVTAQGLQAMAMVAGAVTAADTALPLRAWAATFRYDAVAMQVTSTRPAPGGTIPLRGATLQLTFNEPYDPATVGTGDLTLSRGTVAGFTLSADHTSVTYSLAGLSEGPVSVSLPAGALSDSYGNPMPAGFSASYTVYAGPLPAQRPGWDIAVRGQSSGAWTLLHPSASGGAFDRLAFGAWSPSVAWADVVVGDFDGDGKMDVAGRVPGDTKWFPGGQWWVGTSTGSGFATQLWATWSTAVTWVDVQVGDFNGDGRDDIAARALQSGQWWVALSTGSGFTNQLWTTWNPNLTWVDVHAGDFNGDGKMDLAGRTREGGEWWVGTSTGSGFTNALWARWNPYVSWVDVRVGDFTGDGKADVLGRTLEGGEWWVGTSDGSSFRNALWSRWAPSAGWRDVLVGDFDGDGKLDVAGRTAGGQWWVGLSTGSGFATTLWATWNESAGWADVLVGDFDHDGKADVAGRAGGQWWVGLSSGSSFRTSLWATLPGDGVYLDARNGDFLPT